MSVIDKIISNIRKQKDSKTSILSEMDLFADVEQLGGWIPSGVPELNYLLKTPGYPYNFVIEVCGKEQ
ncbi:MAG: hypothetical protein KDC12_15990, partial [Flavobacteriales bacterium]|nr:hypothetical protein [Flavobacteriales bacterium]